MRSCAVAWDHGNNVDQEVMIIIPAKSFYGAMREPWPDTMSCQGEQHFPRKP